MLYRWNALVGCAVDEARHYRLRALEQVCPGRARFANCLPDGSRGWVEVIQASREEAQAYLRLWAAMQCLHHPHLQAVRDYGLVRWEDQDYLYLVTRRPDLILSEVLDQITLSREEARDITLAVLGCLACLHERGWVHGSVGPETVVAEGQHTKLLQSSIGAASERATPAGDMHAVGRLIVAMAGDEDLAAFDTRLSKVAAACLMRDARQRPSAAEALRLMTEPEAGKATEEIQRKVLWAATAMVMTVATVVAVNRGW